MTNVHAYHLLCYYRLHRNRECGRSWLVLALEYVLVAVWLSFCMSNHDEQPVLVDPSVLPEQVQPEVEAEAEFEMEPSLNPNKNHRDLDKHRRRLLGFHRH